MTTKIQNALLGGFIGTAIMTMVMMIASMLGMPKMSPPAMLSEIIGLPILVGWLMHFIIGIIFAMIYAFNFKYLLKKVGDTILKGAIFGMVVFISAQIIMTIMGKMIVMPPMEGSMVLIMVGSFIGHVIFGIIVAAFVKERS
ncbi:MAG: hypothetical protein ACI9YL_000897 [Luteibaculaceae bacterium]|jgi:hypothetical protein